MNYCVYEVFRWSIPVRFNVMIDPCWRDVHKPDRGNEEIDMRIAQGNIVLAERTGMQATKANGGKS